MYSKVYEKFKVNVSENQEKSESHNYGMSTLIISFLLPLRIIKSTDLIMSKVLERFK